MQRTKLYGAHHFACQLALLVSGLCFDLLRRVAMARHTGIYIRIYGQACIMRSMLCGLGHCYLSAQAGAAAAAPVAPPSPMRRSVPLARAQMLKVINSVCAVTII